MDIRLDIRKITDVPVELSVQPRISTVNPRSEIRNTDIQVDIRADIGATDIGAWFTMDIRGCTDNSTRTSVILRISKRISARTIRPGSAKPLIHYRMIGNPQAFGTSPPPPKFESRYGPRNKP